MKVHGGCMAYNEWADLRENISLVLPYLDSLTIIDGGSTDCTITALRNWCRIEPKLHLYLHKWEDNFPKQRNFYISHIREIAKEGDWILTFDPDEFFSLETLQNLRKLAETVYNKKEKYKRIAFQCRSVSLRGPERCYEHLDDYAKPLFFRFSPQLKYDHHGEGAVHEILKGADPVYYIQHHPEFSQLSHSLIYEHRKVENAIWSHAVRNYFCGGGGNNLGSKNHRWVELRVIAKRLGLYEWHSMHKYLIAGGIDNELKTWIIKYRHETGWTGSSEQREWFKYYFWILHPEELPSDLKNESIE